MLSVCVECANCHLYYHFRCIGLDPNDDSVSAFTCARCKPACTSSPTPRRIIPQQPSTGGLGQGDPCVNTGDDDGENELLQDFFDSKTEGQPAPNETDQTQSSDDDDDDDDGTDADVDCIMID